MRVRLLALGLVDEGGSWDWRSEFDGGNSASLPEVVAEASCDVIRGGGRDGCGGALFVAVNSMTLFLSVELTVTESGI